MLNRPPQVLLTAVSKLRAIHQMDGSHITKFVKEMGNQYPDMRRTETMQHHKDLLFHSDYHHDETKPTCSSCDLTRLVGRPERMFRDPVVHYGLIASGNQVIKDSHLRDHLGRELGACCVDMEAAGLMNNYPCLVVRGICDYADSHKNKAWQDYAAAVAAAYAKELLMITSSASATVQIDNDLDSVPTGMDGSNHTSFDPLEALRKRSRYPIVR
jgi:hypothetical protein